MFPIVKFFCWQLGKTCIGSIAGGLSRMLPEMIQNWVKPSLKAGRRILKAWQKNKWPNLSNFNGGQGWKRNPKKSFKGRSLSKSENVACTATRASPPQFRSVFGQSLVGRGDTCTSCSVHLQKIFLFKQTCFSRHQQNIPFSQNHFFEENLGPVASLSIPPRTCTSSPVLNQ